MKKNLVIIFDFNGTIADTIGSIKTIMSKLSNDFDFKKMKEVDWKELKNKETKEVLKSLGVSLVRLPFILKKARHVLHEEIKRIKPIEGMEKVLLKIKNDNHKLGILTSSPLETVEKFLKINNLDFFDFIYSESNIFGKAKKLNGLLKEKKINPQSVFYVGDETRDITAAKEAGVKAIAVTWGFNGKEILKEQSPDYLVGNPEELIALLDDF